MAWKAFCQFHFMDPVDLRQRVWAQMSEMIVHAIVTFLSGQSLSYPIGSAAWTGSIGIWALVLLQQPVWSPPPPGDKLRLRQPIIGIGAPAGIYLPRWPRSCTRS